MYLSGSQAIFYILAIVIAKLGQNSRQHKIKAIVMMS